MANKGKRGRLIYKDEVHALRLRYIVPFRFGSDLATTKVTDIFDCVNEHVFTENNDSKKTYKWIIDDSDRGCESDVYEYIRDEYFAGNCVKNTSNGVRFKLKSDSRILEFDYCYMNHVIKNLYIKDLGIYLLSSNIGFIWYEIDSDNKLNTIFADTRKLIHFQNIFKEISNVSKISLFRHIGESREAFFMGEWIMDIVTDLPCIKDKDKCFQASRSIDKSKFDKEYNKKYANNFEVYKINENGLFKKIKENEEIYPDKAIIFNYIVFENPSKFNSSRYIYDGMAKDNIYRLTNGYALNYRVETNNLTVFQPNVNIVSYGNRQGCGYYVWNLKDSGNFFDEIMFEKIMADYFTMYIKALSQSFSLLEFSNTIANVLSSDVGSYINYDEKNTDKQSDNIVSIIASVNSYMVKSTTTSVSHIEQQNGFYNYLIDQLRIKGDFKTVKSGLDNLLNIQTSTVNKHNEEVAEAQNEFIKNLETIGTLISVLVIPTSCKEIIEYFSGVKGFYEPESYFSNAINFLAMVILIIIFVWQLIRIYRFKKNKNKISRIIVNVIILSLYLLVAIGMFLKLWPLISSIIEKIIT